MRKVSQLGTMNPTLLVLRWFLVTLLNKWWRKYWRRSSREHVVQVHYTLLAILPKLNTLLSGIECPGSSLA